MNQKRQNICCTSKVVTTTSDLEDTTLNPAGNGDKTHLAYAVAIYKGRLYNDSTGIFPHDLAKAIGI
jgi:hypothetical protein